MDDCLFCKIIAGKIPSKKVYEDDKVYVFEDINPKAPTHVLIIPKRHIVGLKEASPEDAEILGYCQLIAAKIGRERGIEDGYRTVYNVGPRRAVGVPSAPASARRTRHDLATGIVNHGSGVAVSAARVHHRLFGSGWRRIACLSNYNFHFSESSHG